MSFFFGGGDEGALTRMAGHRHPPDAPGPRQALAGVAAYDWLNRAGTSTSAWPCASPRSRARTCRWTRRCSRSDRAAAGHRRPARRRSSTSAAAGVRPPPRLAARRVLAPALARLHAIPARRSRGGRGPLRRANEGFAVYGWQRAARVLRRVPHRGPDRPGDVPGASVDARDNTDQGDASNASRFYVHARMRLLAARAGGRTCCSETARSRPLPALPDAPDSPWRSCARTRSTGSSGPARRSTSRRRSSRPRGSGARPARSAARSRSSAGWSGRRGSGASRRPSPCSTARPRGSSTPARWPPSDRDPPRRRPADARDPLRRALELATVCGAPPLRRPPGPSSTPRARGRAPRRSPASRRSPPPRACRRPRRLGDTNRDIAQALYVTPKTVEVHLSNTYRKLGIRSRRELAGALGVASDTPQRDAELGRARRGGGRAAAGQGRFVLIEGPAGSARRAAGRPARARRGAGLRVLSARVGELEREFAFGVVRQLFERGSRPRVRSRARPRGRRGVRQPRRQRRGRVVRGAPRLYWLTLNLAADGPLLLAVDDLHWVDRSSVRFLAYLAKRLEGTPVLVAATLRSAEPGPTPCSSARSRATRRRSCSTPARSARRRRGARPRAARRGRRPRVLRRRARLHGRQPAAAAPAPAHARGRGRRADRRERRGDPRDRPARRRQHRAAAARPALPRRGRGRARDQRARRLRRPARDRGARRARRRRDGGGPCGSSCVRRSSGPSRRSPSSTRSCATPSTTSSPPGERDWRTRAPRACCAIWSSSPTTWPPAAARARRGEPWVAEQLESAAAAARGGARTPRWPTSSARSRSRRRRAAHGDLLGSARPRR